MTRDTQNHERGRGARRRRVCSVGISAGPLSRRALGRMGAQLRGAVTDNVASQERYGYYSYKYSANGKPTYEIEETAPTEELTQRLKVTMAIRGVYARSGGARISHYSRLPGGSASSIGEAAGLGPGNR